MEPGKAVTAFANLAEVAMEGRERDWWQLLRDAGWLGVFVGLSGALVSPLLAMVFHGPVQTWPVGWPIAFMGFCAGFAARAAASTEKKLADRQAMLEGKLNEILEKLNEQRAAN